jgi:hypothetical protein
MKKFIREDAFRIITIENDDPLVDDIYIQITDIDTKSKLNIRVPKKCVNEIIAVIKDGPTS